MALLLVSTFTVGDLRAEEKTVECRLVYETADSFYVDIGSEEGLQEKDSGMVYRDTDEIARVEAIHVSKKSAAVRIIHQGGPERPRLQDRVVFVVQPQKKGSAPSNISRAFVKEQPFVPLLAPPDRAAGFTEPANIFHGRLRLRQLFQVDEENSSDYSITRLGSDGSLDRIEGGPWSLDWSGSLSYRDGHAYKDSSDYQDPRLDVYKLSLFRKFDDEGDFVRFGRFLPIQLPAVGFLDGAQGEKVLNENFRLGAMAGLKPTRDLLEPSIDEPTAVLYTTAEFGKRQELYYSGTLGALGSLYQGKVDRFALLLDQRADLGPKLNVFSTSEFDFDAGNAETRNGARLTRTDLYAYSPITTFLALKAGLDHYERPDTAAERDLLDFQDDRFFDRGYWRYWIGSTQHLPWKFTFDEEIAFIDAPGEDFTPRWRVGASHAGNLLDGDQITVMVFNLDGLGAEGYGGRLWALLPLLENRLALRPGGGFRYVEADPGNEKFEVTDLYFYADWWISKSWSAYGGITQYFGDSLNHTLVELGIDFRW